MIQQTAAQMADALAKGETSSVELTQAHLDRITAVDGQVKAFLHVDSEGALAQAKDVAVSYTHLTLPTNREV